MTERRQLDSELFLGRVDEQQRFRALLDALLKPRGLLDVINPKTSPPDWSYTVLIRGVGGIGKSTLSRRLRDIANGHAPDQRYHGKFKVLWIDWEHSRNLDPRLAVRESVAFETVLDYLYTMFRDAGFGDYFNHFEAERTRRTEVEARVERALNAPEASDQYAPLGKLGAAGLAMILRTSLPYVGALLSQEGTAAALEVVIGSGAHGLEILRTQGHDWLHRRFKPEEYDIFVRPHETLSRAFAEGVRAVARHRPLVIFLDTYEIVDRCDSWLRQILRQSDPRVIWVLSGRNNLAESRYGRETNNFVGYQADAPADRLRIFPLGEFSQADVAAYFARSVPTRPLTPNQSAAIHRVTHGIPLAIKTAAAIWSHGIPLEKLIEDLPQEASEDAIVRIMTERFLVHASAEDVPRLYALALAFQPDYDLLAALCNVEDVYPLLAELERRYDFVFAYTMTLHDAVRDSIHDYLRVNSMRYSPEVREPNKRAVALLEQRLSSHHQRLTSLDARAQDEHWVADTRALLWHRFWLDEATGWSTLTAALSAVLAYDREVARAMLDSVSFFAPTWTKFNRQHLKTLKAALSVRASVGHQAKVIKSLVSVETTGQLNLDDGCADERDAILLWWHGHVLHRQQRYQEASEKLREAARRAPESCARLRLLIGEGLTALSFEFLWPEGAQNAVYSPAAEEILLLAAQLLPTRANVWYRMAACHIKATRREEAIAAYKKAIELDPKYAYPWNGLGNVYRSQHQLTEAIEAYQKAIELDPKFAYPWNGLGNAYADQRQLTAAIEAYQKAIELDPKFATPWSGLGNVYRGQRQRVEAIDAYQKAIELDPKFAYPWNGLGNAYADQRQRTEAITAYKTAIELDPKFAYPWNGLGNVYRSQYYLTEAITAYQKAIELDPKFAAPWSGLGNVYHTQHQLTEAIEAYQRAIELDLRFATPWSGLGNVYHTQHRLTEAIEAYQKAIELDPRIATPWSGLGSIFRSERQLTEAIEAYHKAIELDPEDDWSRYNRSLVFVLLGQTNEAQSDLSVAIGMAQKHYESEDADWLNTCNLALYYLVSGQLDEAEPLYQIILSANIQWYIIRDALRNLDELIGCIPNHAKARAQRALLITHPQNR